MASDTTILRSRRSTPRVWSSFTVLDARIHSRAVSRVQDVYGSSLYYSGGQHVDGHTGNAQGRNITHTQNHTLT